MYYTAVIPFSLLAQDLGKKRVETLFIAVRCGVLSPTDRVRPCVSPVAVNGPTQSVVLEYLHLRFSRLHLGQYHPC